MQIPSVQLDAVGEDSTAIFIGNRNPQPGEVQIPVTAPIEFDVFGDAEELQITVNGVTIYQAGTWANAWQGSVGPGPSPDVIRVLAQPSAAYGSGQRVITNVYAENDRFTTWSFIAYDTLPPLLEDVTAVNETQVRVRFSEPVLMLDSKLAGDALNPDSYLFERMSRPAVTPSVSQVDKVTDSEVLLTTELELSYGAGYMLVVTGIQDEFGNVFSAPDNVAEFTGFLPPFPARRRWLLHDFVPRIALAVDNTQELSLFLGCLQDTNNVLLSMIDRWIEIIDPDTAPEAFVDAILRDLSNPFDFELELSQKRRLAKLLVLMYQLKGTALGIVDVIRFFLNTESMVETFAGRGWRLGYHKLSTTGIVASPNPIVIGPGRRALYSFRVHMPITLSAEQLTKVRYIATFMKGAQEHLVGVVDPTTATPRRIEYWRIGVTDIGWSKLAGTNVRITSFTLSD